MTHIRIAGIILSTMLVGGVVTTTAFALPDISITLGGAYPLHLNFADNGTTETQWSTEAGTQIEGKGVSILLLTSALSALGTFTADFLHITRAGTNCNSAGDASAVVLWEGSFHVVYTNLSPLTLGILLLPKNIPVNCGALEQEFKGSLIAGANGIGTEATELAGIKSVLHGTKGKQQIKEFYNDAGTKVRAIFEGEFGTGFVETSEAIAGEPELTALEGKMFVITGR